MTDNVQRVRVTNIGANQRIIHDVDGKMTALTPGSSAVLLLPQRQIDDLSRSKTIEIRSAGNEELTQRAIVEAPQTSGEDLQITAAELLAQADVLPYRDFKNKAREILGDDEFEELGSQPKKKELIAALEKRV